MTVTTEALMEIGLTKEQADKVFALRGEELANTTKEVDSYKEQIATLTTERDGYKTQLAERDKDIKDLKKTADEELSKQMTELQNRYKSNTESLQEQLRTTRLESAITSALAQSDARNPEDIMKFLDRETVKLADDGTVTGLDEQLQGLKESKAYLFKTETQTTGTNPTFGAGPGKVDLASAVKDPGVNLTQLLSQKQGE